jgi:hypothetical protein
MSGAKKAEMDEQKPETGTRLTEQQQRAPRPFNRDVAWRRGAVLHRDAGEGAGRVCLAVVTGQCEMPDESFGRSEPQLKRPALEARVRARVWFVLRGNNCDDSHLVEALK